MIRRIILPAFLSLQANLHFLYTAMIEAHALTVIF